MKRGSLEGFVLEVTVEPADEQGEKPEPNSFDPT
jgi:hypothetical protein